MAKVEEGGRQNSKYSRFDKFDTAVLEAILQADFDAPEAEQMEMEQAFYISNLIAERKGTKHKDAATAKAEFFEHYYPLVGEEDTLYDFDDVPKNDAVKKNEANVSVWLKNWRRFASAAAVILIFLFFGTVTAYAFGFDPVKFIGSWNDDQFWYEEELVTTELSDKVAVYSNEIDLVPKALPESFVFDDVNVFNSESFIKISADFYRQTENGTDKLYIDYMIYLTENRKPFYEKDAEEVNIYVVNNIEHYIMSNLDKTVVTWRNGDVEGSIKGDFSREEAEKMIDSIYGE